MVGWVHCHLGAELSGACFLFSALSGLLSRVCYSCGEEKFSPRQIAELRVRTMLPCVLLM